jgi:hypothetical protein
MVDTTEPLLSDEHVVIVHLFVGQRGNHSFKITSLESIGYDVRCTLLKRKNQWTC